LREVKLGCVFTQNTWDAEGYAIRDPDSTTYTGAIETAETFGRRIYLEAWNRGWSRAEKKVVIGDGAEWIWNLADQHFPCAVQIVDLYHARQHLWDLARRLHPNDPAQQKAWMKVQQKRLLDKGKIERLVLALRSIESTNAELSEKIRTEADYFERNAERMRYPKFRRQHLFVGSGVIEAGCKTVIGSRLKQSGMFWTVAGANSIIALRCCHLNGRFEKLLGVPPRGISSMSHTQRRPHAQITSNSPGPHPVTACHRIPRSNVTSFPPFLTARPSRYRSVSCFCPAPPSSNRPSSSKLTESGQNRYPATRTSCDSRVRIVTTVSPAQGYPGWLITRIQPFSVIGQVAHPLR